jgi:hypothetical protein
MNTLRSVTALILTAACTMAPDALRAQTKPDSKNLSWVRVTEHAGWQPRDSSGEVVYNSKMWLLGGWFDSYGPFPHDVWNSSDGVHWNQVTQAAPWVHADLPVSLVFDNKMWMMSGWYKGRFKDASASNQVWRSVDGANWECATAKAAWPARCGAAGAVHHGKMWILGGTDHYYVNGKLLNDVWSSTDGVHWEMATRNAPWPPRAHHAALAFNDKLWVMGGGNYRADFDPNRFPAYLAYNDVWSSADGVQWNRVTDKAPWQPRLWFSALVYKNRMWMLGGWSDKPSQNWNDVWYSSDGANWKELKTDAVWSKRHEHSAYVFDNKIWVVGGNPWPCDNQVWQLDIPDSWFEKN